MTNPYPPCKPSCREDHYHNPYNWFEDESRDIDEPNRPGERHLAWRRYYMEGGKRPPNPVGDMIIGLAVFYAIIVGIPIGASIYFLVTS